MTFCVFEVSQFLWGNANNFSFFGLGNGCYSHVDRNLSFLYVNFEFVVALHIKST